MSAEHVVLIDGSGFIFRAFYAIRGPMTRSDGTPVNAVYGFTNMLMKLLKEMDADRIAVIFDKSGTTFRNEIYPQYKANRSETPEDLIPQFSLIREATRAFNLPCIEKQGFEADDLIATYSRLAREAGARVTIVSSDKDMMQLVGDNVTMYDGLKGRRIGIDEVIEKFGVKPDRVIDVQSLAGDASDNVPGVPGIGIKTAAELINRFGDLDAVLDRAAEVTQPKRRQSLLENAEAARTARQLVTLVDDVPLDDALEDLHAGPPDVAELVAFLKAQDFGGIIGRVEAWLGAAPESDDGGDGEAEAVPDRDYELVQDVAALERWIARARDAGTVTLDTETTSLDALQAKLVGVSLSVEPGSACYIPLGHGAAPDGELGLDVVAAPKQVDFKAALELLGDLFADRTVLKVGQNIKYDMSVLANHGLTITPIDDTMLLSYVLDGGLRGHGMDALAKEHLKLTPIPFKSVVGTGKKQITFDQVPLDAACDYAAEDADITGRLHRHLKPRLVAESMTTVYETLERPLIPVLVDMERAGIKVDRAVLVGLSNDFAGRIDTLAVEIHQLAGREFTIGSPKQLGEVLFDEMGLPAGKKGKTGAYTTDANILDGLAAEGHDIAARVLEWRQLAKLKSTYTDALVAQINPATGRVHTSFSMAAAATGRLASSDPNLQNIPVRSEEGRKIRHAFIAEPGHKLLSADYSQIELRLAAHVAGVDSLKKAFHDGLDIHAMTAAEVFGVPLEGMDPMVRRRAKAINFGIIYGISPFGLARQLGIGQSDAKAYIEAYFERFPGIRDYMEETKAICREQGYVTTLFGRRCHLPGINDKNGAVRAFNERAAINAPLQGGAADIIKRAMIRMPEALARANLSARMLLQVHDELIFEVPDSEAEATATVVKAVMEGAAHLSVPLVVDTGVALSWADAH